jgi:hypothetical protein
MKAIVIGVVALLMAAIGEGALADVPELINYQGILTDSGGQPLDGTYDLTFKIYPDTNLATPYLWKEVHLAAEVDQGLFNVILGSVLPIPDSVFAGSERYLGIAIDMDPEMTPRMRITSVPWALRAAVADTALVTAGAGDGYSLDAEDGDPVDVVYVDADGKVGINTTTVGPFQLFVNGDVGIPYTAGYQISSYDAVSWDSHTGSIVIGSPYTGLLFNSGDTEPRMMIDRDTGDVGINTTDPAAKLDIFGNLRVSGGAGLEKAINIVRYHDSTNVHTIKSIEDGNSGLQVSTYLNGDIALMPGGIGKVGIGTTTPVRTLDVNGTARMNGFWLTSAPTSGYVLTSDATGVGTWRAPAALPDGDWTISGDDMYSSVIGNVGVGEPSPGSKLDVDGDVNVSDDYKIRGEEVLQVDGTSNVSVGREAGKFNTSWGGAFVGRWAGHSNQGACNTFLGAYAGTTSTGGQNTFVGFNAGNRNGSGNDNTFIGYNAGQVNTEGYWNTFIGFGSGSDNVGGDYNTFLGMNSGGANVSGNANVFLGYMAGNLNDSGENNVFVGGRAGNSNVSGSRNVFVGYRAGYSETGSDNLYIANGQYDSNVLIYGDFAQGNVGIGTLSPSSGLEIYKDTDGLVGLTIANPNTGSASSEAIYFNNEDGSVTGIRIQNSDQMSIFNNRPAGYISYSTSGLQRMVIANNGNVGIGTGSPDNLLHVDGVVQIGSIETISDIGSNTLGCDANWCPQSDNYWSVGSSTNRWTAVWAVDGTINTSDVRLKESISDLQYGLNEVMKLRPISFTWRDRPEAGRRLGLIAQEVQPVIGEVVADTKMVMAEDAAGSKPSSEPAENLGIYYSQLVPVLIKAVQEQQGLIEEQAERIQDLEARIAQIEGQ